MVVDFPAPLGPRKPCTSPARSSRSRAVEGADGAEALDELLDGDDGLHVVLHVGRSSLSPSAWAGLGWATPHRPGTTRVDSVAVWCGPDPVRLSLWA